MNGWTITTRPHDCRWFYCTVELNNGLINNHLTLEAFAVIHIPESFPQLKCETHSLIRRRRRSTSVYQLRQLIKSTFFFCQVANPGQALQTLGSAFLNIMWPYELANEKWLLYPASLKFDGHSDSQCTPSGALNPLKLYSSSLTELPQHINNTVSRISHFNST